jgi:alkylation response protein AidB-like acyl-CoA dehydrogenase
VTRDFRAVARRLADEVLFPDTMRVDGLDAVPAAHLGALAAEGLYGAAAPTNAGGLGLDLPALGAVTEELVSGCLTTAFVWVQHCGVLRRLVADSWVSGAPGAAAAASRGDWIRAACRGKLRGGVALAGQIPGPPLLRAQPDGHGWRLDGTVPWVTGWGMVDVLLVAARGPSDSVVTLLMDAAAIPGLTVSRYRLAAVDASVTVKLGFDGVVVPAERFVSQKPFDPAASLRPEGLRLDGSLALGVALRCCRLLGRGPLDDEVDTCRARLDDAITADADAMVQARAAASELALRAAAALAVYDGSKSVTTDQHAQRLGREALFLMVFGSRPPIKSTLLDRLGASGGSPLV